MAENNSDDEDLLDNIFNSMGMILINTPKSNFDYIKNLIGLFITKLNQLVKLNQDPRVMNYEENIITVMQTSFVAGTTNCLEYCAPALDTLIALLDATGANLYYEAFLCISTILNIAPDVVQQKASLIYPRLNTALQNAPNGDVFEMLCNCLSDVVVAYSLTKETLSIFIKTLLGGLDNDALSFKAKPCIIKAFADMIPTNGDKFFEYVPSYLELLNAVVGSLADIVVDPDDEDMLEYINGLQCGILNGMNSIVLFYGETPYGQEILQQQSYIQLMVVALDIVAQSDIVSESSLYESSNLI